MEFLNTKINRNITFRDTNIKKIIFKKIVVYGNADFSYSSTLSEEKNIIFADFSDSEFHAQCNFINRCFEGTTLFNNIVFHKAPKFHGGKLHQFTDFNGAKYLDISADAESSYRTLKLFMENIRSPRDQANFFAYEQKCHRKRKDVSVGVKLFSWLYEISSDYGRSLIRPLIAMFTTIILSTLIYAYQGSKTISFNLPVNWNRILEALIFSIQQSVSPFYVWKVNSAPDWYFNSLNCLKITATIQSLLILSLFAIFLLALRWNFRR